MDLSALSGQWRRMLSRERSKQELDALPAAERVRLAQDVGFPGSDLRRFACSHEGPQKLMPQRLGALGVDAGYVKHALPATYRDLERVCGACKSARRCERDLARGDAQAGMNDYCLNAPTIDSLIVGRVT